MKVIVAGSRTFNDYELLEGVLDTLNTKVSNIEIVSGTANGADKLGEKWANKNNKVIHRFRPDWSVGKGAGYIRNKEMAEFSDACIVFWDGKSVGTKHMIDLSRKNNLKLKIVMY
jgi:hypothetical protein